MNFSFLQKLLDLYHEFGPIAQELLPVIQGVIAGIKATEGMTTEQVLADTRLRLDHLDAQLIEDLKH